MEEKSNTAYLKECKSDKKISNEAKALEAEIQRIDNDIYNKKQEIKEKKQTIALFSGKLEQLEQNQDIADRYKEVSDRLKNLNEKATKLQAQITMVDKNTALLDKLWILCAFPSILSEFKKKSSLFSKEKRLQEKAFNDQKAKEEGRLEAMKEIRGMLKDGVAELPWYLPNQETMEEMINDKICKVCGRPAPEGSDAYNFMVNKLEEYKRHVEADIQRKEQEEKSMQKKLFVNEYIEEIHNLSIRLGGSTQEKVVGISKEISDRLQLEDRLKQDLSKLAEKIQNTEDEKARLLIQAGNVTDEALLKDFNDIKGMFEQKGRAERRFAEL